MVGKIPSGVARGILPSSLGGTPRERKHGLGVLEVGAADAHALRTAALPLLLSPTVPVPIPAIPPLARRLRRLTSLAAALLAVAGVAACRSAPIGPETARAFAGARAFEGRLVAAAERDPVTPSDTAGLLALGYLERARLGMGSPFRLVDFALQDPRLPAAMRDSTAWAVLAMVYDGRTHQVDPLVLDSLFEAPAASRPGASAALLARLERVVGADPRVGEQTVRLSFALLGAEGLLRPSAQPVPARVAAQLRDRRLAREDLSRLLRVARTERVSAVGLVPSWRLARRLAVEQPVMAALDAEQEAAAVAAVPALLAELRAAATAADAGAAPLLAPTGPPSLLSAAAGARLAALPQTRALPPASSVVVALTASRPRIEDRRGFSAAEWRARGRFVTSATTEETLVAYLAALGTAHDRRTAQAALWAAVSVRPFAQEEPWFPGSGGPTVGQLRQRFAVAAVSFDRDVPVEWRPYYRRLLATSVEDLRRVLPEFSLAGVAVHFGRQPLKGALAVHDPRTRTLFLPLGSGAGAVAHELAHDLDWQVAAKRFGRRGEYSSDQAVREQRGRLATSLRGLTSASLVAPGPENQFRPPHAQRPTEVFASSVDWFVAAGLAREGRMSGYLSSVQDELFTGFADVRAPDAAGAAGEATIEVLGEMTAVAPAVQRWFRATYGAGREPTAGERAQRVVALATADGGGRRGISAGAASPFALDLPLLCVARDLDDDQPLRAARREAAMLAADAVARRALAARGIVVPGLGRVALGADGQPVLPVDAALVDARRRQLRDRILARVQRVEDARSWLPTSDLRYAPYCD